MVKKNIALLMILALSTTCVGCAQQSSDNETAQDTTALTTTENEMTIAQSTTATTKAAGGDCDITYKALELEAEPEVKDATTPGEIDLSSDEWLDCAYSGYDGDARKWSVKPAEKENNDYKNETVSEDTLVLEYMGSESSTLPAGTDPVSLHLGNSEWSGYSLSFDFLLSGEYLGIKIFDCSSLIEQPEIGKVPFTFEITRKGLYLQPSAGTSATGGYIKNSAGEDILAGINYSIWNNIKLTLYGDELHLILNGNDLGVIWTYDEEPSGGVGFESAEGVMIKNIVIK